MKMFERNYAEYGSVQHMKELSQTEKTCSKRSRKFLNGNYYTRDSANSTSTKRNH